MAQHVEILIINCNQCELYGPIVALNKLYELNKIRHPNAWHIRMNSRTKWDGYVKYISKTGKFSIGLLPHIYDQAVGLGYKVSITDERPKITVKPVVPKVVGKLTLRASQKEVLKTILNNKVGGIPFYIGVQDLSVNFGKTAIMAGLHLAFKSKLRTLILTNDSDWLEQSRKEFPELITGEPISYIQGGKSHQWSNINIGMVQTLSRNLNKFQGELSKIDMVLIDECDLIDNRSYSKVIQHLWNTTVRIGLSGTIYLSNLKKDLIHNMNIRSFIGNKMTEVTLLDTIKSKHSTNVIVKMVPTNYNQNKEYKGLYPEEYKAIIVDNKRSYSTSLLRTQYNLKHGRWPMLIVTKFIEHCDKVYNSYIKNKSTLESAAGKELIINRVYHYSKDRKKIIEDFRQGKIDILISNTFIARGKNFPLLRYLQNNSSLDSNEKTIQLLGRLVRTHKGKNKAYLDDIAYNGKYLSRHSTHRYRYYKKQGLKVIKLKNLLPYIKPTD